MDRLPANPTIVFIPGAFHTAAHFGPLSLYLNKKGYDNFALRLPSVSERAGKEEGGLAHDVASIKALLEVLVKDENSVVLVMHDTGAIAGTQAAVNLTRTRRLKEGKKKGGIISMVFIDGILSREGESLESMMRNLGEPALPQYAVVDVSFRFCVLCFTVFG